jgi:hypothetical protein
MGRYINADSKGNSIGTSYREKIDNLKADGATVVAPTQFIPNLVCVVDNGPFAAAAYCYSEGEFKEFNRPDGRDKTWLTYEHAETLAK